MNYAPGVTPQGGQFFAEAGNNLSRMLYSGLQDMGKSVGDAIDRHQSGKGLQDALSGYFDKELEEGDSATPPDNGDGGAPELDQAGNAVSGAGSVDDHVTSGKRAQAIRSLLGTYSDNPQLAAAAKGWSTTRLEGFLKGMAMRSAMQEHQARMEDYHAQAQERQERSREGAAVGTALNKFGEYMSQPGQETDPSGEFPGVTPPSMQQGIIHALRSIGGGKYAAPALRALTDYAQTMSPAGGDVKILPGPNGTSIVTDAMGKGIHIIPKEDTSDQTLSTTFDEDPITGARFASRGKVLASSGYNPKAAAGVQPVLVHDQNGRAIGFNQTDLRGHTVYHPTQAFDPAKDSENNIIPGWYSDGKRMYDTRALLEKQLGVQPGTNAPAAARPAAKPAAKPAAAPSGKIIVQRMEGKTMKQYKLPKEQKADAIKAGYTVVSE